PARAGLPARAGAVAAQAGQLVPGLARVGRAEERSVLDAGIDRLGVGERRLDVPDPLELPGPLRPVVMLVGRERLAGLLRDVVDELVALALRRPVRLGRGLARRRAGLVPRLPPVVRALDDLAEPPARLRGVEPVGVGRRGLDVVDLPAREVGSGHLPAPSRAVGREDERALARPDEYPYSPHGCPPFPRRSARAALRVDAGVFRSALRLLPLRDERGPCSARKPRSRSRRGPSPPATARTRQRSCRALPSALARGGGARDPALSAFEPS